MAGLFEHLLAQFFENDNQSHFHNKQRRTCRPQVTRITNESLLLKIIQPTRPYPERERGLATLLKIRINCI